MRGEPLSLCCVFSFFKSAGSICSHIAAFNILYEIRMELSRKLARLPLGYFSEHASGSIKKIMSEDVERIEHFVAHNIVDFVSGVVTPLVTVVFMFAVDWRMALAAIISIPIALIAGRNMFGGAKTQELSDQYQMAMGKMNGSAVEYVKGMPVIKTFSEGKTVYASLKNDIENSRTTAVAWAKGIKTPYILFNVLISASILFIFPVGTFLLSNAISYQTLLIAYCSSL
jgi:ATP-binding cassette subfamily B protein